MVLRIYYGVPNTIDVYNGRKKVEPLQPADAMKQFHMRRGAALSVVNGVKSDDEFGMNVTKAIQSNPTGTSFYDRMGPDHTERSI